MENILPPRTNIFPCTQAVHRVGDIIPEGMKSFYPVVVSRPDKKRSLRALCVSVVNLDFKGADINSKANEIEASIKGLHLFWKAVI